MQPPVPGDEAAPEAPAAKGIQPPVPGREQIEPAQEAAHPIDSVPTRIEYPGPHDAWRRDPRLSQGECASSRGWLKCQCNGFCRNGCPGRSKHESYNHKNKQKNKTKSYGGCPNPATSDVGKPRCASCECQVSGCHKPCFSDRQGFCSEHRREMGHVTRLAARVSLKQPAAAR